MSDEYRPIGNTVRAWPWRRVGDLPGDKPLVMGDGRIVKTYARDDVDPLAICSVCGRPMATHGWIDPPQEPVDPLVAAIPVDPVTGKQVKPVAPAQAAAANAETFPQNWKNAAGIVLVVHNPAEKAEAITNGFSREGAAPPAQAAPTPAPSATALSYPQDYVKSGSPNRRVANQDEAKAALADGFEPSDFQPAANLQGVDRGVVPLAGPAPSGTLGNAPPAPTPSVNPKLDPERGDLEGLVVHPGDWVLRYPSGEYATERADRFPHFWVRA
jgi:hypothetical protein